MANHLFFTMRIETFQKYSANCNYNWVAEVAVAVKVVKV